MARKQKSKRKLKPHQRRAAVAKARARLPIARFDAEQSFACRDCPARCCRMPWGIRFSEEEAERYTSDAWVQQRVNAEALAVLGRGVLPMREHDGLPQCVFLDNDERCGMQKEHGHAFIPRACQVFPFGFVRDEDDKVLGSLSYLCPSVQSSIGEAAAEQLGDKLEQQGGPERMSTAMSTLDGVILPRAQYLRVVSHWQQALAESDEPLVTVSELFEWTSAFETALPGGLEKVTDEAFEQAMRKASKQSPTSLSSAKRGPGYAGRMLFAQLLGSLCHPARVLLEHRVEAAPWYRFEKLRAFFTRLSWLLGWGRQRMMFITKAVPLRRVAAVVAPARGALGREIASFLRLALERRQLFSKPRQLQAVLLDLAYAAVLSSRFARCRAAADGRLEANRHDVLEGMGVSELLVVSHAALGDESEALSQLRWTMLSQPESLRRLLAAESM